jgi:hypothetical protein
VRFVTHADLREGDVERAWRCREHARTDRDVAARRRPPSVTRAAPRRTRAVCSPIRPATASARPCTTPRSPRSASTGRYESWDVPPERSPAPSSGCAQTRTLLGANVSLPHKEAVLPLLDDVTPRRGGSAP